MYEQIFYYNLTIFQINDFVITINALLLLVIFLISLKLKKTIIKKVIYLIIIVGVTNLFVFTTNHTSIDLVVFSKLNFFIYNLLNYPINSLNTYFMIYSYLNILVFIPFYLLFNKHQYFIYFVLSYILLQILFVSINISSTDFSVYYIFLNIIGYLIGYLINYVKGGNVFEYK